MESHETRKSLRARAAQRLAFSPANDPLWTVEEVASFLRLTPDTVRAMARRGDIPAVKLGRIWRFQKSTLKQLLDQGPSEHGEG